MIEMIEIDGSYLEGGGQIIRTALALSALTGKAFKADNIRKGRDKPGLKNQHLYGIKALQQLCNAHVEGAELGSTEITFIPREIKPQTLNIDIGTAGSITLILQSLLLPCVFEKNKKPTRIKITGGTDVAWSPQADYLKEVIQPQFRRYADIDFKLIRRGYYPAGGGKVDIKIKPRFTLEEIKNNPKLKINMLEQGRLLQIRGISHASKDLEKADVAERTSRAAKLLLNKYEVPVKIGNEYVDATSTGSGITLWAVFGKENIENKYETDLSSPIILGADVLGERGKKSEIIGEECAKKLVYDIESLAPVDVHLADNLIPLLGLVSGQFKASSISSHAKTNIYVVEKFLDVKFEVRDNIIGIIKPRL